jgi:Cu/Ag efflux protein CusF
MNGGSDFFSGRESIVGRTSIAALALLLAAPIPAFADSRHEPTMLAQAAAPLAEGEVRRIDKEANKLTIRHGPLANLDMPPMTMVFQVKDPALLQGLKPGDKIRFQADKVGGAYTVTHIEPAN